MKHVLKYCALLLAVNYFCFRVEVFDRESDANQRSIDTQKLGIGSQTVNWETFDKDNAPKAFVFNPEIHLQILKITTAPIIPRYTHQVDLDLVRDKSPPFTISQSL